MTPYRQRGARTWTLTIRSGAPARPWVRLTSGTRDRATAEQMQRMLDLLLERGRRELWVRDALVAKRLTIPAVSDAWLSGGLEALRASLDDADLADAVDGWREALDRRVADGTFAVETRRKYVAQVRTLVGAQLWRSQVTVPWVKDRLAAVPGSGTNRRRHAAAWSHFLDHCVEAGLLAANPLRQLALPKSNRARERWAEWPHVVRLLHAMPEGLHRALAAVRHGAGLEMLAALAMRRRDVDLTTRVVWAHGTKTATRDRQALVLDDTCWELFAAYVRAGAFLPDALLFPVLHKRHAEVQAAAGAWLRADGVPIRDGYTLHASRHSFAVEMVRRGHELRLIAANLGHGSEAEAMRLYAKYRPRAEDLIRAAKRALGGQ